MTTPNTPSSAPAADVSDSVTIPSMTVSSMTTPESAFYSPAVPTEASARRNDLRRQMQEAMEQLKRSPARARQGGNIGFGG